MKNFKKILILTGFISILGTSLLTASQDLSAQSKQNRESTSTI